MSQSESDKTLRIIEYWKKAYDATNKNKNNNDNKFSIYDLDFKNEDNDNQIPYEPTAVLAKAPPNQPRKTFSTLRLEPANQSREVVNTIFIRYPYLVELH
ncbi:MAG: hypothetical protein WCF23_14275 [Candidatus Nitrosopolaris sp.]